jgi:hypothetical protein
MNWTVSFPGPAMILKDGRKISTLGDAHEVITDRPQFREGARYWQDAFELLTLAAQNQGWIIDAQRQLWRALRVDGLR